MATLTPPQAPKGHRRVKSLAKEFEDVAKLDASHQTSPASKTSPSNSPNRPVHSHGRAASVSAPLPSPPFTYKSSAFTGPNIRRVSGDSLPPPQPMMASRRAVSPVGLGQGHKRVASVFTSTPPPPPPIPAPTPTTAAVPLEPEEAAEQDDVFLPLSSPSAGSVFTIPSNSSPSSTSTAHSRSHSRIHERNLSAFFPRPGQGLGVGYGDTFDDPHSRPNGTSTTNRVVDLPSQPQDDDEVDKKKASRRGHHHKHSVSHAHFSFMDPSVAGSMSPPSLHNVGDIFSPVFPDAAPSSHHQSLPFPSQSTARSATPASYVRILVGLPIRIQAALWLAMGQIVLGATLWIRGQAGESLAVTGLGYLVVFDGLGGLSGVLVEGSGGGIEGGLWLALKGGVGKSVRFPFGTRRLVTLSHFAQAIYLLFSAVYVCKESVEHVLLLHGGGDEDGAHGAGHGGMGHGESALSSSGGGGDDGISLPLYLLTLSAILTLVSAFAFSNHQTLSATALPSASKVRSTFQSVLNPFTLTIFFFSAGLAGAARGIPSVQLAPLDKVVALLQSIAMFYIAYPAAVATGQVLLQTAPPEGSVRMVAFSRGLQDIENHPLVVSVAPPHIWQLDPSTPSSSSSSASLSESTTTNNNTLILTLSITCKSDASDSDILTLTRFARERCLKSSLSSSSSSAIGKGHGVGVGETELCVQVRREKSGAGAARFFASPGVALGGGGGGHEHEHGGHSGHAGHGHHH